MAAIAKSIRNEIRYASGRDMADLIKKAQDARQQAYEAGSTGKSSGFGKAGTMGQAGTSGQFGTASQAGTSSYASTFYTQPTEEKKAKKKIDHNITPYK